ncbi:hypothetical protein [Methylosinus sp. PW1]|uniref:hypothetical protein n=1 Tax=Methylosinus sp. PW1 TaxID=107636 RepID=UPI000AB828D9|nr:hypothetical protein [Methylosinus sp. PW1]
MTDDDRKKKAASDRARMNAKFARTKEPDQKPRIDTMAICRRFAAGEIDRAELSRQLRGA